MKWLSNIFKHKEPKSEQITLRPYQEQALQEIKERFKKGEKEVVLSIAPSGGKTTTALHVAKELGVKTLVLAHATEILRNQWLNRTTKSSVEASSKIEDYNKVNVVINLPQSIIKHKTLPKIDLLIVDEAHQWYSAKTVKTIIKRCKPSKILLLTGTPAIFIRKGIKPIIIAAETLIKEGYIENCHFGIATTSENIRLDDYTQDGELKKNKKLIKVEESFDNLVKSLYKYLISLARYRLVLKDSNPFSAMSKSPHLASFNIFNALEKTLVSCASIKQAKAVYKCFNKNKIKCVLSTSDIDIDSKEIERFQKDKDIKVLIVVNRGVLGFDMPELVNVVDMSLSMNINSIYQLYARVLRKHPKGERKMFFRVVPENFMTVHKSYFVAALCLMFEDFIGKYNGKNLNSLKIPYRKKTIKNGRSNTSKVENNNSRVRPKLLHEDLLDYVEDIGTEIFIDIYNKHNKTLNEFGFTNIKEIKRVSGLKVCNSYTFDEVKKVALKYNTRNEFRKGSPNEYNWAIRNEKLDEVCSDMVPGRKIYTLEQVKKVASKYNTRKEFEKGSSGAYNWARKNGKLDEVCGNMKPQLKYHTLEQVKKVASKYNTRGEFQKGSPNEYSWALRNKKLDEVCGNMASGRKIYTLEQVKKVASKYNTRNEFKKGSSGAYNWARKNGKLDEVCSDMKPKWSK